MAHGFKIRFERFTFQASGFAGGTMTLAMTIWKLATAIGAWMDQQVTGIMMDIR